MSTARIAITYSVTILFFSNKIARFIEIGMCLQAGVYNLIYLMYVSLKCKFYTIGV